MKGNTSYIARGNVLKELSYSFNYINKSFKYLKNLVKHKKKMVPASQWILDNIYLIEKEYKSIKRSMTIEYFKGLPKENYTEQNNNNTKKDSKYIHPRIFIVAKNYINSGLEIEEEELINYINNIQKQNKEARFTMGELWAFSLMLRISVIINLSHSVRELINIQDESFNNNLVTIDSNEELLEDNIGRYITDIRTIESVSWRKVFEKTSIVEEIFNRDPSGVYKKMDFESKDYYRHKLEKISYVTCYDEIQIADEILKLAQEAADNNSADYKCHIGYYLIDDGINDLKEHYYGVHNFINSGLYIGGNIAITVLCAVIILYVSLLSGIVFTKNQLVTTFFLILIPINEIVLSIINWVIGRTVSIRKVPKLDFSKGIPDNCKTVVVIPSITSSCDEIKKLMKRLEVEYVGNMDENIYFALLNDFCDCDNECDVNDKDIINTGITCAEELNLKYCRNKKEYDILENSKYNEAITEEAKDRFFFLNRKRVYSDKQRIFMGRERKRGKLMEFMALIRGKCDHTFDVISSDINPLRDVKYIITLDSDTFMPREYGAKLIGTMEHILNKPYVKRNRVVRGYGVMQPKVSVNLESKNKTNFSKIFAGEGGVDGYSVAYSDVYQDLFGEGTFTGKGIINVDVFYDVLNKSIKNDRILSHDLIEGAFARCALVSDIEFIDDYPSTYKSSSKRLHRWVRGDWQLVGWIFSRKISLLYKWKIFDNIKRSLLAPNLLLAIILSLTFLNGNNEILMLCFLALISPLVFTVTDFVVTPKNKLMGTFKSFEQCFLIISFIPYQAYLMANAICKTLYRMIVTRRNLLEWEPYEKSERKGDLDLTGYLKMMWISPVIGALVVFLSLKDNAAIILYDAIVGILWIASPFIAFKISKPIPNKDQIPDLEEKEYLRKISRRIWAYYEDFVNEENNYLPPDNYQEKPLKGAAHRTSPTNIGMALTANVNAYDLGYITVITMVNNIEKIINNMEKLQKEHGHYLNWYDTKSMKPLWPRYISTVDNGNLLTDLWIVKQTLEEVKNNQIIRCEEVSALKDIYKIIEDEDKSIKIRFIDDVKIKDYINILNEILLKVEGNMESYDMKFLNNEVNYWVKKIVKETKLKIDDYHLIFDGIENLYSEDFLEGIPSLNEVIKRVGDNKAKYGDNFECTLTVKYHELLKFRNKIDKLISRIDEISVNMDFKFLYNKSRNLFSIGYNVEEQSLGNSYYDLLASEARGASFISIAKNDIKVSHWFKLSREMTNAFHTHSLVSWSGTMFEYFMPALVMKNYEGTLLNRTYKSVLKAQMLFCKQKKVPWGISEAAYHEFDVDENYQYKAFGIPGLGLKRGLEDEIVVSPYSTLMVLPFNLKKGLKNLKLLEKLGASGRYGFIESVDYTNARKDNFILKNTDKEEVEKGGILKNKNIENYEFHDDKFNDDIEELENDDWDQDDIDIYDDDDIEDIEDDYVEDEGENIIYSDGIRPNLIRTYMVHHLGMSFMALNNVLNRNILINRFHEIPSVKATELILKEKIPKNVTFERDEDFSIKNNYIEGENLIPRVIEEIDNKENEVLLLSNGMYSSVITSTGSGYSQNKNMMLYRWKGDSVSDDSGMFFYIKNLNSNEYWSASYEPCKNKGDCYRVELNLDNAEFYRKDGNIETQMKCGISPDKNLEVRKITLNNCSEHARSIEITSYMEIILTQFQADAVHPAFSNLFIQTEYDKDSEVLIGNRRGRSKDDKVPYIFHKVFFDGESEGNITYETSRINFIGRNRSLKNPYAMDNDKTLENTVGTVLDPIMSMRIRIRLQPNEKRDIYFIAGTANDKDEVLEICKCINNTVMLERIFEKYHIKVQLELKDLKIKSIEANIFQKLIYHILFITNSRKNRFKYIRGISKYQKNLWAYGISGDLPIVMLKVRSDEDSYLISNMIKFHKYLKNNNLVTDFLIYNDEETSYEEPMQKHIFNIINILNEGSNLNKSGGIFIYNKSSMNEEIKDFIIGISSLYIDSDDETELEDIEKSLAENYDYEDANKIIELNSKIEFNDNFKEEIDDEDEFKNENLDFFNGYGGFSKKDKSYIIKLSNGDNTPAPWINVMANDDFGFHISESGSSYTWCGNSRENKITPWSNDYIRDSLGEALYIRDNKYKTKFSISIKPIRDENEYIIKHGFGYSEFRHNVNGMKLKNEVFIPRGEKVKIQRITLKNIGDEDRDLSLFYYAQLVLGVYSYQSSKYISTNIHYNKSYICGRNPYSEYFGKEDAYLSILGGEKLTFTGDRREFIGLNRDLETPEALEFNDLSNRCGSIYDPCLAACTNIIVKKGEVKHIIILLGQDNKENIEKIINKYSKLENVDMELDKTKEYWRNFLGNIQVKTCDKSMDYLLNGWLLYQTLSCRYLSRTAFYQSGGAYGFRDQLQDSMSLGIVEPEIMKAQILRSASRQYVEGDVQHWWHPVVNSGIRTRFSDDLLWLPYVTAEYINSNGDYEILSEEAVYLEDEPLKEGEDERYTIVNASSKKGTIYEHCIKAIKHSLKFGVHNIPLMGSGDWNDGMSTVGNKGKGESVWLGWFLYSILNNFIEIAKYMKDFKNEELFKKKAKFIRENIEKNAWDGGWYRRAYFDDGTPLGSRENPECQIDSIAQSWSVISGAARESRAFEAMEAVDRNLVKKDRGMILLLTPPFDNSELQPGYIKGYVPGVRENGGQYTHAAVWVILALTKLKECKKAVDYYHMINPINHSLSKLECMIYKAEPYVMAADIYIKEPHGGRGGWSWYTGASGWMYKVGIESILGLKKIKDQGYKVEPCIPQEWDGFEINIKNKQEDYHIKVTKKAMLLCDESIKINTYINGELKEDNIIPRNKGKLNIEIFLE